VQRIGFVYTLAAGYKIARALYQGDYNTVAIYIDRAYSTYYIWSSVQTTLSVTKRAFAAPPKIAPVAKEERKQPPKQIMPHVTTLDDLRKKD
jgi:hypothetical protein